MVGCFHQALLVMLERGCDVVAVIDEGTVTGLLSVRCGCGGVGVWG